MCREFTWGAEKKKDLNYSKWTAAVGFLHIYFAQSKDSDLIIHKFRMWRSLHERDSVEDVVNVVAEMENRVGNDCFGGGNAS